jgi:hypothetical protein
MTPGPHKLAPPFGPAKFSVSVGGIMLLPETLCTSGRMYLVKVVSLCGENVIETESSPKESCSARDLARRCQLVGSMQHVSRQGCIQCKMAYLRVPANERSLLHTGKPVLGNAGDAQTLLDMLGKKAE